MGAHGARAPGGESVSDLHDKEEKLESAQLPDEAAALSAEEFAGATVALGDVEAAPRHHEGSAAATDEGAIAERQENSVATVLAGDAAPPAAPRGDNEVPMSSETAEAEAKPLSDDEAAGPQPAREQPDEEPRSAKKRKTHRRKNKRAETETHSDDLEVLASALETAEAEREEARAARLRDQMALAAGVGLIEDLHVMDKLCRGNARCLGKCPSGMDLVAEVAVAPIRCQACKKMLRRQAFASCMCTTNRFAACRACVRVVLEWDHADGAPGPPNPAN